MADRLVAVPDSRKPTWDYTPRLWTPGGPWYMGKNDRRHIVGPYSTTDGVNSNENYNAYSSTGNLYNYSGGYTIKVEEVQRGYFYTQSWIGSPHLSDAYYSATEFSGPKLLNSGIKDNFESSYTECVKGFTCEVSAKPFSSTSNANAFVDLIRVQGAFADQNGRVQIYDFTTKGTRITGHQWNTKLTGDGWRPMAYYCNSNGPLDKKFLAWIFCCDHAHDNTSGSQKYQMTVNIRYMQPLVAGRHGGLYEGSPDKYQLIEQIRRWDNRNSRRLMLNTGN